MVIKDPSLGKYSIAVQYNKYVIYAEGKSITTVSDFNDALRDIAKRIVLDMDGDVTLGEYNRITTDVFDTIKRSFEMIPLTEEELKEQESA